MEKTLMCRECDKPMVVVAPGPTAPLGGYRCDQCGATARRVQPPKNFTPPRS